MSERQIHITRQGTQYGPYPESSVKDMLAEGQLLSTDLAWYEGAEDWKPLQELLGTKAAETPPPIPQDIKPEEQSDDGEQSGKIRVMRNGEAIGPYTLGIRPKNTSLTVSYCQLMWVVLMRLEKIGNH